MAVIHSEMHHMKSKVLEQKYLAKLPTRLGLRAFDPAEEQHDATRLECV